MPRKAPDTVEEKRITLGNYERQTLDEFNKTLTAIRKTAQIPQYVIGGGVVVIGGALGFAAYTLYKYLDLPDLALTLQNAAITNFAEPLSDIVGFAPANSGNSYQAGAGVALASTKWFTQEEVNEYYDPKIENLEKKIKYMKAINAGLPGPLPNVYSASFIARAEKQLATLRQSKGIASLKVRERELQRKAGLI